MNEEEVKYIVEDIDRESKDFVYGVNVDGKMVRKMSVNKIKNDNRRGKRYEI